MSRQFWLTMGIIIQARHSIAYHLHSLHSNKTIKHESTTPTKTPPTRTEQTTNLHGSSGLHSDNMQPPCNCTSRSRLQSAVRTRYSAVFPADSWIAVSTDSYAPGYGRHPGTGGLLCMVPGGFPNRSASFVTGSRGWISGLDVRGLGRCRWRSLVLRFGAAGSCRNLNNPRSEGWSPSITTPCMPRSNRRSSQLMRTCFRRMHCIGSVAMNSWSSWISQRRNHHIWTEAVQHYSEDWMERHRRLRSRN